MKKIFSFFSLIVILLLVGCTKTSDNSKLKIVSTIFPGYDFARAVVGDSDDVSVSMLLKPGIEIHSYEPSPKDIINIKSSDLFIYVGGESEEWVDELLDDINYDKTKVIKMMDYVDLLYEEVVPGMDVDDPKEKEYDEHVWTSPKNAIKIIDAIYNKLITIDDNNKSNYKANTDKYVSELNEIDKQFIDVVNNSTRKEIIFGDRFPLRYFVNEYGLTYYAAFLGCAEETEASAKTISFLVDKVKTDKIPVVFKIEMSNGNVANTIKNETGAKVLEFNSTHNISASDFKSNKTYVDFMRENILALKEAID